MSGWPETDVVSDYVSAPCYKLVCSDPNDAIISEAASLKVSHTHIQPTPHPARPRQPSLRH